MQHTSYYQVVNRRNATNIKLIKSVIILKVLLHKLSANSIPMCIDIVIMPYRDNNLHVWSELRGKRFIASYGSVVENSCCRDDSQCRIQLCSKQNLKGWKMPLPDSKSLLYHTTCPSPTCVESCFWEIWAWSQLSHLARQWNKVMIVYEIYSKNMTINNWAMNIYHYVTITVTK